MNEENVRKLSSFYEEIWKNSKRFTKTNEDAPSYIDVNEVFELVDKYDAINEQKLEVSEKARKEAIEYIKELYDNTDDTTCYDIDKDEKERLLQILDIDKGE